ncbi:hypothetical protein AQUCO_01900154v1 [Aquilegia coerulea]|uniref:Fe2OG dioxygenase domain-containing protein n=1 Tax=Aquilegia coerulea TaxID=218851 RepID=A0A2G5DJ89_AQUCA|nr:hypothetical protein AQUCO_01900154v1 [Aquilegia coerulea]
MSPAMTLQSVNSRTEDDHFKSVYQKGVKHLCDSGITKVPNKYVLPISDRALFKDGLELNQNIASNPTIQLPIIDFSQLQGPNRSHVLKSLAKACEKYGFFQIINHELPDNVIKNMIKVAKQFFELPFEERAKLMSNELGTPVRYGTSFNQNKDGVFCWRDFLKLMCNPDVLHLWPSSPMEFRKEVLTYSKQTKQLFMMAMEAVLESLGLEVSPRNEPEDNILEEFHDGSQMMVINCYPACPEPDLTLGMPPHSDYGFLTLLLQDEVKGLQIQHEGNWFTVDPLPNSFVVNVGDHLEIFSNGRYKSVLHRVLVNSSTSRVSVASLHSLPLQSIVRPWANLVNEENPRKYKDTDFASFLEYISSCEPKSKNFLESRKLT